MTGSYSAVPSTVYSTAACGSVGHPLEVEGGDLAQAAAVLEQPVVAERHPGRLGGRQGGLELGDGRELRVVDLPERREGGPRAGVGVGVVDGRRVDGRRQRAHRSPERRVQVVAGVVDEPEDRASLLHAEPHRPGQRTDEADAAHVGLVVARLRRRRGGPGVQQALAQVVLDGGERQVGRGGEGGDAHAIPLHWIVQLSIIGE